MHEFDLTSPILAVLTAALAGFLVGIVPVGAAEALAIAIGVVRPAGLAIAMAIAFTVAHVAAKTPWYWLGMHAERATGERSKATIAKARAYLEARPSFGLGVLSLSAFVSLPPFHLTSIAAGLVRIPFVQFLVVALLGRALRFGLLAAIPGLVGAWLR